MNRYRVLVHGENFYLPIEGRYCKVGFYTLVFVSCSDSLQAGQIALRSVQEDSSLFSCVTNNADDPPRLNVTDVEEVDADSIESIE